jgi:hypothetical protein
VVLVDQDIAGAGGATGSGWFVGSVGVSLFISSRPSSISRCRCSYFLMLELKEEVASRLARLVSK